MGEEAKRRPIHKKREGIVIYEPISPPSNIKALGKVCILKVALFS
jgi:hypothetical protein